MSGSEFMAVHSAYRQSAERLIEATEALLPVGSLIEIKMGNAVIDGEVVSSGTGSWWYHPDQFSFRNLKTGKFRHSTARYALESCELVILQRGSGAVNSDATQRVPTEEDGAS